MMMNTNPPPPRDLVYLAGLLHDIGKFLPDFDTVWKAHPLYTDLAAIAPDLMHKADRWATAIDEQTDANPKDHSRLANLFDTVQVDGKLPAQNQSRKPFGFHKLSLNKALFDDAEGSLEVLRQDFKSDFKKLSADNHTLFADSLTHLLRQYTWCLPASEQPAVRAVSLFHHLKLTAAFALCLHEATPSATYPVQLLCVDLSGIQSFIYNIGSRYAAKSLKGRSFSLQLLLDNIARRIQQETHTFVGNVVYSSGGKFFMLLPNTTTINTKLGELQRQIAEAVWDEYAGQLFVCFGQIAFNYEPQNRTLWLEGKNDPSNLSALWRAVAEKASEQKVRKNSTLLLTESRFQTLFEASGKGGNTDLCAVTGQEGKLQETKDGQLVHPTVKQQIRIGANLNGVSYLTFGDGPLNLLASSVGVLSNFDLADRRAFTTGADYCQLMKPGRTTAFVDGTSFGNTVRSFRFFGGSQQAKSVLDSRVPKTFEELAGIVRADPDDDKSPLVADKCEGNYRRLAVLRMDVDSLGKLFTHGFKPEQASFSAYATLSGLLDWFFSGYLNTIRDRPEFRDWVNIIYSGGDDVFAVGRWDRILSFADVVQQEFKSFTGRKDLTISAGIELMRPRFPIGKAADAAGEAEDQAKDHSFGGKTKNAVCLFGLAVNWDTEWPTVISWKNKLVGWLTEKKISKGILQKLFSYYEIYADSEAERKAAEKHGQPDYRPDLSWKWNAAYSLARHRTKENSEAIDALKTLLFTEIHQNRVRFEAFAVALRWAELEFRDNLNNNMNEDGTND